MRESRLFPLVAATVLAAAFAHPLGAAVLTSAGIVRGTVTDKAGAPIGGADVVLFNTVTGRSLKDGTSKAGAFFFYNVPTNPYHLHVEAKGWRTFEADVDVHAGSVVELAVGLEPAVQAAVDVSAEELPILLDTDRPTKHVDLDRSLVERAAAPVASRGLEALVLQTPGFMADENGRFHFQGSHGQVTYVVDGAQISDQLHATFSNSLDPQNVDSAEVITGNVPAEYAGKLAAVVSLTTKSGLGSGRAFGGQAFLGAARFGTLEAGVSASGGSDHFGYYASVAGSRSDRLLDPVVFENLHNEGKTGRLFARFDLLSSDQRDAFRMNVSAGRTDRDVAHLPSQEAAGQDQTTRTSDAMLSLAYTRFQSADLVVELGASGRLSNQLFRPSPGDTPLTFQQDRDLDNAQLSAALSGTSGAHAWKLGVQGFFWRLRERFSFGVTDAAYNDPASPGYNPNLDPYVLPNGGALFRFRDEGNPRLAGLFLQDTLRLGGFTAQVGFRLDQYALADVEESFQPRVGLSYYVAATGTVLRASYNRLFMTPENENLLLVSSPSAAALAPPEVTSALGTAQLRVRAERQDAWELGLEQRVGRLFKVSLSVWRRDATNFSDSFQLLDTGLLFPVTLAEGRLRGADLRVDLARTAGLSGYLSLGTAKAEAVPPFTGGLFVSPEPVEVLGGGPFRIDHDQKLSGQLGLQYEPKEAGIWFGAVVRYDSGLVTEVEDVDAVRANPDLAFGLRYVNLDADPTRVKPRTVLNLSAGADLKRFGLPATLQVDLLNALDEKGLYNFLSVFGGTHVVPPRTWAARIRTTF